MALLEIRNLSARVAGKEILKGVTVTVNAGEVHAIMGPNGSGKSTLANVLAGRPGYEAIGGTALYQGKDLLPMKPENRAREGVFLAFQYPVEIPGVGNAYFLKSALNAIRRYRSEPELDAMDFMDLVNDRFAGGEKKRNEIFQMAVLEPRLAVLDETDSGLDIDALKVVANGVNSMRNQDRAIIVVTHYQRILNYIVPDRVHVLLDGRIVKSGGEELAHELEKHGYAGIEGEVSAAR